MKKALALTFAMALILSAASVQFIHVATANPYMASGSYFGEPTSPSINVLSPSEKLTYWIESDVWLDLTVTRPVTWWYDAIINETNNGSFGNITKVSFSLDGILQRDANKVFEYEGVGAYSTYSVNLGRLTAGQHTIITTAEGSGQYGDITLTQDINLGSNYTYVAKTKLVNSSANINFVVDGVRPTAPPNLTLLSPTNETYYYHRDWTSIPYVRLEYKADDTHLSVGYSLDGDSNIIPVTNGSKINIPILSRRLTLYANDSFGNSASPQTVYYEIQQSVEPTRKMPPPPPPRNLTMAESSPTLPNMGPTSPPELISALPAFAAAGVLIIITLSIFFWVYFKKHKCKATHN